MAFNPKGNAILLAALTIRSDTLDGGVIPDDECQADFIISDGSKDSYGSIMTEKTLRNFQEDAERGVPFMMDHGEGLNMQLGRTIAATYDETEKQVRSTVSILRDTDDTPENMKVNEYIRRMERRFYDSASVGFREALETCNIQGCGKEIFDWYRSDPCPHVPKRFYDGEECTYNVDDARLREVSLVPAPSNDNSKLLDTRQWDEDFRKVKQEGDNGQGAPTDAKTLLEADGLKWREELIVSAIKEGVRAEDDFDETKWRERFKTQDSDFIREQTETWTKLGDAKWGEGGRKTDSGIGGREAEPTLWFPENLFRF